MYNEVFAHRPFPDANAFSIKSILKLSVTSDANNLPAWL